MAAKKKNATKAPSKKHNKGKKNGMMLVPVQAANHNKKKKPYHKNPQVFGVTKPVEIVGMIVAVIGGVTVVKLVPAMFPVSWTATNGTRFFTTAGIALLSSAGAHFLLPTHYRDAYILGAGAQTVSIGLNIALPSVSAKVNLGRVPGGRGVGDFVPGGFPVPQNPVHRRIAQNMAPVALPAALTLPPKATMGRYKAPY